MGAPCGWFDATPVGRIVNRFSQDISTVVRSFTCCVRALYATFQSES